MLSTAHLDPLARQAELMSNAITRALLGRGGGAVRAGILDFIPSVSPRFQKPNHLKQLVHFLERAHRERSLWMAWLRVDPSFRSLRSEPRFQALMTKMKF